MQAKLEKEEIARQAKEKRTMELLLKRKEAQDRNRAKVQAEQERLDRIDGEAKALGDITIDESWLVEIEEIKATISALKWNENEEKFFAVKGGTVEVLNNHVTILAQ